MAEMGFNPLASSMEATLLERNPKERVFTDEQYEELREAIAHRQKRVVLGDREFKLTYKGEWCNLEPVRGMLPRGTYECA